jgi:uncharacterized membrane protein
MKTVPEFPVREPLAHASADGVSWLSRRNCSMTPRQMGLVYVLLCGTSLSVAAFFWGMGAILVLPFAALELLALGIAFVVYARHATDREHIRLDDRRLVVEWECGGRWQKHELPREWVRVIPSSERSALVGLTAAGQTVEVGRYMRPEQRRRLANELRQALRGRGVAQVRECPDAGC